MKLTSNFIKSSYYTWAIKTVREDFNGLKKGDKVAVRENKEMPDAIRGKKSFWILTKQGKLHNIGQELIGSILYSLTVKTVTNSSLDSVFSKELERLLKFHRNTRLKFGYSYFVTSKPMEVKGITLPRNTLFVVCQNKDKIWDLRFLENGENKEINNLDTLSLKALLKQSVETQPMPIQKK